jgi:hypothetical protein
MCSMCDWIRCAGSARSKMGYPAQERVVWKYSCRCRVWNRASERSLSSGDIERAKDFRQWLSPSEEICDNERPPHSQAADIAE